MKRKHTRNASFQQNKQRLLSAVVIQRWRWWWPWVLVSTVPSFLNTNITALKCGQQQWPPSYTAGKDTKATAVKCRSLLLKNKNRLCHETFSWSCSSGCGNRTKINICCTIATFEVFRIVLTKSVWHLSIQED